MKKNIWKDDKAEIKQRLLKHKKDLKEVQRVLQHDMSLVEDALDRVNQRLIALEMR